MHGSWFLLSSCAPLCTTNIWPPSPFTPPAPHLQVSNGILVPCPHVHVRDYLGSTSFMQATLEKANVIPDPSMSQVCGVWVWKSILPVWKC